MTQITIDRALLEQAIEALSYCEPDCEENTHGFDLWANVLPPLREALAQPQPVQEPVYQYQYANGSWCDQTKESHDYNVRHGHATVRVLYTSPQAQPAQPLSDEQKQEIHNETGAGHALISLVESYITKGTT